MVWGQAQPQIVFYIYPCFEDKLTFGSFVNRHECDYDWLISYNSM